MRAWQVVRPGPIDESPLQLTELDVPEPGPREIRVAVVACGVCRTDLHIAEGDLSVHKQSVVPGHEVVGRIDAVGSDVTEWSAGDRVGIAWLRYTCGSCRFCRRGDENLCESALFTGWDEDGGYAEYAVVDADYAYRLPDSIDDQHAAPLLCAGIIGYRALRRSNLPTGGVLGIWGFGASAHITAQIALAEGARVHVMTRNEKAQELARDLGADSVQDSAAAPPGVLDSAILFAPAGELVPVALAALDGGGTLAIAGIHLSPIRELDYSEHLFRERKLVSVTANTRGDGRELLAIAERLNLRPTVQTFDLSDADRAMRALADGEITGAAVLVPSNL